MTLVAALLKAEIAAGVYSVTVDSGSIRLASDIWEKAKIRYKSNRN